MGIQLRSYHRCIQLEKVILFKSIGINNLGGITAILAFEVPELDDIDEDLNATEELKEEILDDYENDIELIDKLQGNKNEMEFDLGEVEEEEKEKDNLANEEAQEEAEDAEADEEEVDNLAKISISKSKPTKSEKKKREINRKNKTDRKRSTVSDD